MIFIQIRPYDLYIQELNWGNTQVECLQPSKVDPILRFLVLFKNGQNPSSKLIAKDQIMIFIQIRPYDLYIQELNWGNTQVECLQPSKVDPILRFLVLFKNGQKPSSKLIAKDQSMIFIQIRLYDLYIQELNWGNTHVECLQPSKVSSKRELCGHCLVTILVQMCVFKILYQ